MVSFTIAQKLKEAGIRKTLGANNYQVYVLIVMEYLWLVVFASIVGIPLAIFSMDTWLMRYPIRIDNQWLLSLFTFLIVVGITWLTISYKSYQAANVNPTDILE